MTLGDGFSLMKLQVTMYVVGEPISRPTIWQLWAKSWANQLDGAPEILPATTNIPTNFPHSTFNSEDGCFSLQIAEDHVNASISVLDSKPCPSLLVAKDQCLKLIEALTETLDIVRLSLVIHRAMEVANPVGALNTVFLAREDLAESKSLEFHIHREFRTNNDLLVNTWIRHRSGFLNIGPTVVGAIVLEQDINSDATNEQLLSQPEYREIFDDMIDKAEIDIARYYSIDTEDV